MSQVPMAPVLSNSDAMIDLNDIAPAFLFVIGKGFMPGTSVYKPQEFGNASLVMTGVPFSLRLERDRGQVFVDVGSDASGWYKLEYVLEFVDRSITQQQLGEPPSPGLLADLLQARWDKVVILFGDHQRILELQTFAKQKSAALLNKIFGKR